MTRRGWVSGGKQYRFSDARISLTLHVAIILRIIIIIIVIAIITRFDFLDRVVEYRERREIFTKLGGLIVVNLIVSYTNWLWRPLVRPKTFTDSFLLRACTHVKNHILYGIMGTPYLELFYNYNKYLD